MRTFVSLLAVFLFATAGFSDDAFAKKPAPNKIMATQPSPPKAVEQKVAEKTDQETYTKNLVAAQNDLEKLQEALKENKSHEELGLLAVQAIASLQKIQLRALELKQIKFAGSTLFTIALIQACYIEWREDPLCATNFGQTKPAPQTPKSQAPPPAEPPADPRPKPPIVPHNEFPKGSI